LIYSWGLEVVIGKTIGLDNQLAGTDEQRAADFSRTIRQSQYKKHMVCKRRLWNCSNNDLLDFTKFKQHPKWIVGFSDITVLHNHFNTMGFKTLRRYANHRS
jgi:muramoyltetrapeptide carboxypeptidase